MNETKVCIDLSTYTELYAFINQVDEASDREICQGPELRTEAQELLNKLEPPSYYIQEN